MKTRLIKNDSGSLYAFEIDNVYIGTSKAAALIVKANNVSDVRRRKMFSGEPDDVLIRFKYLDKEFILVEPWGDSSDYWIGPIDNNETEIDISDIERLFGEYHPPLVTKIIGDILTLNFRSLFSRS